MVLSRPVPGVRFAHPWLLSVAPSGPASAHLSVAGVGGRQVDALAVLVEVHGAVGQRKQAVVLRPADVDAGGVPRPALRHDDATGRDELALVRLDAAALRQRIAAV